MQATALEEAILKWIAVRQPSLRARLCSAQIVDREHTGAGFYVYLSPDKERDWDHPPVDGPVIESALLDSGGGCILWFSGGEPHCLEIYAFGNDFPEVLDRFRLSDGGSA